MVLNVDIFKNTLKGGGARPNLFNIKLSYPAFVAGDTKTASILCKAGSLPSSTIPSIPISYKGSRQINVAGDRVFEPWGVVAINDTDFAIKESFERWMNGINSHQTNVGFTNPNDYQVDLEVEQLDRDGTVLKTYKFIGAFPTLVGQIELSYDATGQIQEYPIEFMYQYWESNTTN